MPWGLDDDQWRRLCLRAFENLPADTAVTMADVDAILTWCLPEYEEMRGHSTETCLSAKEYGQCLLDGSRRRDGRLRKSSAPPGFCRSWTPPSGD